jgi:predicted amidohydrolase YtcJ
MGSRETPRAATLFPLREAHAHLASLGESLAMPSAAGCASVGECLDAAARATRGAAVGGWARLTSARVAGWTEQRWPSLAELDGATHGVPCVVMSFDHHEAMANSAALAAAGLVAGQRVGAHGEVETDREGAATGLLREDAAYAAWGAAAAARTPAPEAARAELMAALEHLGSLGYAEVHDLHSQPWLPERLAELDRAGALPMPVWLYPPAARLEEVAASRGDWESARLRLGGGKVFADGTLNGRTALMLHRYAEPLLGHPRGQAMVSPAALDEAYARAWATGFPLAVHAIGDGAVRMVLDSIQRVRGATADAGRTPLGVGRQRIEHAEIVDAADVPRFAGLGVVCSVQPCHLLADVEALRRFVPHRLDRVLPLRELIDRGCAPGPEGLLWLGSDVPIVRADPGDSIQAAVHRRRAWVPLDEAIAPAQAISIDEAWAGLRAG